RCSYSSSARQCRSRDTGCPLTCTLELRHIANLSKQLFGNSPRNEIKRPNQTLQLTADKTGPDRFDSCRPAISSPLKSAHLKLSAHYDRIFMSSFASPFRFVRTSLLGGTAPAR